MKKRTLVKSPDKFLTRGQVSIGDFSEEFECAYITRLKKNILANCWFRV